MLGQLRHRRLVRGDAEMTRRFGRLRGAGHHAFDTCGGYGISLKSSGAAKACARLSGLAAGCRQGIQRVAARPGAAGRLMLSRPDDVGRERFIKADPRKPGTRRTGGSKPSEPRGRKWRLVICTHSRQADCAERKRRAATAASSFLFPP